MSTDRTRPVSDFDRLAAAWLSEGPTDLNDEVLDAALSEVSSIRQRRPMAPWRTSPMSISASVGVARLAASAAIVALVVGGSYLLLRQPSVGPGASPSVTPSPSPTGIPIGVGLTQPFISPRYGYTVQVPIAWQAAPATSDWHPTDGTADLDNPMADVFQIGPAADGIRAEIVAETQPIGATSASWTAQWERFRVPGGNCLGHASPWVDAIVAGIPARTFSWHCGDANPVATPKDYDEYAFLASAFGFVIHGTPSMVKQLVDSFGPPPTAVPSGPGGPVPAALIGEWKAASGAGSVTIAAQSWTSGKYSGGLERNGDQLTFTSDGVVECGGGSGSSAATGVSTWSLASGSLVLTSVTDDGCGWRSDLFNSGPFSRIGPAAS
ncbi:MAG TPA: hypothetical protein VF484_11040 [Candidatus Limnocylindrales bacterium]